MRDLRVFSLLMVFRLVAPAAGLSNEFSFEAVGEVRCTTFGEEGTNSYFSRYQLAVSGCNTLIRSKLFVNDPDYTDDYHECACQGSNSTLLIRYGDQLMFTNVTSVTHGVSRTVKLEQPQRAWNQATLMIRPDPLPPYGFEALTAVWLAYGSRCHFGQTGRGLVSPVVFIGNEFRESGIKAESQWTVESKLPRFLMFMAEFSDGNTYDVQGSKIDPRPLPKPFDAGFTNAVFTTIKWTNVAGYAFPQKFELLKFDPAFSSKGGKKLKVAYMMVGEMQSFNLGSTRSSFVSELPERCNVIDFSHPDERSRTHFFTYRATNGKLMTYEEFNAQPRTRAKSIRPASKLPGLK